MVGRCRLDRCERPRAGSRAVAPPSSRRSAPGCEWRRDRLREWGPRHEGVSLGRLGHRARAEDGADRAGEYRYRFHDAAHPRSGSIRRQTRWSTEMACRARMRRGRGRRYAVYDRPRRVTGGDPRGARRSFGAKRTVASQPRRKARGRRDGRAGAPPRRGGVRCGPGPRSSVRPGSGGGLDRDAGPEDQ